MTSSVSPETDSGGEAPAFDTSVAHSARVYDYWLGGKDNFAADRAAGEQVIEVRPAIRTDVQANRAFLGRAVRYLAGEAGIRQFLDIGTGPPVGEQHPRGRPVRRARRSHRLRRQRPDRARARPRAADQHARGSHRLPRRRPARSRDDPGSGRATPLT